MTPAQPLVIAAIALVAGCATPSSSDIGDPPFTWETCPIDELASGTIRAGEYANFYPDHCPGVVMGVLRFDDPGDAERYRQARVEDAAEGISSARVALSGRREYRGGFRYIIVTELMAVPSVTTLAEDQASDEEVARIAIQVTNGVGSEFRLAEAMARKLEERTGAEVTQLVPAAHDTVARITVDSSPDFIVTLSSRAAHSGDHFEFSVALEEDQSATQIVTDQMCLLIDIEPCADFATTAIVQHIR